MKDTKAAAAAADMKAAKGKSAVKDRTAYSGMTAAAAEERDSKDSRSDTKRASRDKNRRFDDTLCRRATDANVRYVRDRSVWKRRQSYF